MFTWKREHRVALALLCAVQLLEALDITVATVALPTIRHELGFSAAGLQWVLNAYGVMFGGFLLLGGRAGDLFGRRRVLLAGVTVFTLASLASGLAQSPGMLIASRAAQGLAAAFSSPMTLGMLASIFPEGSARNRAVSIWGVTAGLSSSLGLIVGGLVLSGPGWRWIFFINVPFGVVVLLLARRYLPAARPGPRHRRYDAAGAITGTGGLSLLAYAVVQTNAHGWGSARTIALLAGAVLVLAAFVVNEIRIAPEPLIPASLLRNRSVTAANVVSALMGSGLWAMFYFTTLYQQDVRHHTALATGALMVPLTATLIVFSATGPLLVRRIGVRYTSAIGSAVATVGLVLFARSSSSASELTGIIGPSIILSAGFGLLFIPLTIAAMSGVDGNETGVASGLLNTTRQVAGALGLAIIATIATSHSNRLLHQGHTAISAASSGFDLGYAISAGLMALTAIAALLLLPDAGQGIEIDLSQLAVAGVE